MVVTTTRLRDVVLARRFDSQFFGPEFIKLEQELGRIKTESLSEVCLVSDGNHASVSEHFSHDEESGPRYLRGQDIGDFFLDNQKAVYIPWHIFNHLRRSHMQPGDVLLSIVGTVGALSLVPDDAPPLTGSCKIAILRPASGRISPQYLAAFLSSLYGQFQIKRWTRGTVQTGFILDDTPFIRIVRLGALEEGIADIVDLSYKARLESRVLYQKASMILEEELGVPEFDRSGRRAYQAKLCELSSARRWDSGFYKPKFRNMTEAILRATKLPVERLAPLRDAVEFITNGHTPLHHDQAKGDVEFLTAEHVSDFRVSRESDKRILLRHHTGELARTAVRDGDILVTIKGRVGNCAVARISGQQVNINQDVALLRLRPGFHSFFLSAWFNSRFGKEFVEQRSTGGINPFLGLGNLQEMPFPIIDRREEARIGGRVQAVVNLAQATEAESIRLLAEAKQRVEAAIQERS